MKQKSIILVILFAAVFFNLQAQEAEVFRQQGIASWYGREYEGRPTASGEIFDSSQLTAAHPSLPFGTMLVVTNQHNNKSVTVRVNDRGPFVAARIIDVSRAAAEQLDMIVTGTAPVLVESINRIVITSPASIQTQTQTLVPVVAPVSSSAPIQTTEIPSASVVMPVTTTVVLQPAVPQIPSQITLTPAINIMPDKTYRLQVGSYRIARNAVDVFDKLKDSGLNPAYERYSNGDNVEYFRVVLAGVRGTDVQLTAERLRIAGFKEALIREEN